MHTMLNDHVLIEIPEICAKVGSFYMPDEVAKKEQAGSEIGQILAMGPKAFADEPVKPKIGDFITFVRYAGRQCIVKQGALAQRLIYDTDVFSIVDDEYLEIANVVKKTETKEVNEHVR